jgi:ribose-phosphate pyrophosphokinase
MIIIGGNSNTDFAERICKHLGHKLCDAVISSFKDGESYINIKENVRHKNCFIIQPTCSNSDKNMSINDSIIELLIIIDALKRGSADQVNVVIPYYGYSRQDRKDYSRAPISAAVIAKCLESQNINRIIVFDLHAGQISGFFSNSCPLDNLYVEKYFLTYITNNLLKELNITRNDIIVVAPDEGSMKNIIRISQRINCGAATFYKSRNNPNEIDKMILMGDIKGKVAIIIDDIIDTAGTICKAANELCENGALYVYVLAAHGLFSGNAIEKINASCITNVIVSNTCYISEEVKTKCSKLKVLDVSWLCAEAIRRQNYGESLRELYNYDNPIYNYPIGFL